jgi:hypothetical protein
LPAEDGFCRVAVHRPLRIRNMRCFLAQIADFVENTYECVVIFDTIEVVIVFK